MGTDSTGTGESTLELLWGTGQRASRGPKPKLSVERIARVAIEIADAEGLGAMSMQRVAAELGFTTMSLYRYVPGKEQLLEVISDLAAGRPPAGELGDWRAEMERWVRELLDIYRRHPWALRVEISGPPRGPNQLAWFDAALQSLSRTGLGDADMISAATFLLGSVRELARISLDIAQARERAGLTPAQAETGFADALRTYVDAERFPALAGLSARGVFDPVDETDGDVEVDLAFGVQRLLDGIQAYVTG